MPQIQVFQCPACGANLSYDGGPEISFACQFCGTSIIVPEELRPHLPTPPSQASASVAPSSLEAAVPDGLPFEKLAEIKAMMQNGREIDALKLYREIADTSLAEAKAAVEKLAAGEPVVFSHTTMETSGGGPSERSQQMAEVMKLARAGEREAAIALLQQAAPTIGRPEAERAVDKLAAVGAARTAARTGGVPPVAAATPARRSSSCGIAGCFGILVAIIAILGATFAFLPSNVSDIVQQVFVAATATVPPTRAPRGTPTRTALQADATQGAKAKAAQQVQATQVAAATATRAARLGATSTAAAAATATVVEAASATADALATAQTISTTLAAWPRLVSDSFVDNRLGWPVGPSQDQYFSLNTSVQGKKYVWAVTPKRGAYANGFPADTTPVTDFSATVKVKFAQGGQDGNSAFGLAFRHTASEEYGFFGVDLTGHYRVQMSFNGIATEPITGTSAAIHTQVGQVNQLTVQAIDSDFVFLVNNQVVYQITQDAPAGDVGVGVDVNDKGKLVQVEFTDFDVHAPKQ